MAWAYTTSGQEMARPSADRGIHIDGPLSSGDLRRTIEWLVEELVEQSKREASTREEGARTDR